MQLDRLLLEEKGKLAVLMNKKFIPIHFSPSIQMEENNLNLPRWMDVYILIYQSNLEPDIRAYDILLQKLSTPVVQFCYSEGEKDYLVNANPISLDLYLWYLITGEEVTFSAEVQYIPKKVYRRELFQFHKFASSGISLQNIEEDKFRIAPTLFEFDNYDDAMVWYNKFLDAYDTYRSLKLSNENFIKNIHMAMEFGKDKRMLATISNILSYFNLSFILQDDYVTLAHSDVRIRTEKEADRFQVKLIDAYQFFRNVVNAENKKDIVSEIYNRKLAPEIREQFEQNVIQYLNAIKNQELVDWIVTIAKESKHTLQITFDEQGVFDIEGTSIANPTEAKEFYIDYMDSKKEKLAMTIYKNNIVSRIKTIWNKLRAKFAKT